MKRRKPDNPQALYLQPDFRITNEDGKVVSLEDAKRLWNSPGALQYWNKGFESLVQCDFDLEAVKRYYSGLEAEKRQRKTKGAAQ